MMNGFLGLRVGGWGMGMGFVFIDFIEDCFGRRMVCRVGRWKG